MGMHNVGCLRRVSILNQGGLSLKWKSTYKFLNTRIQPTFVNMRTNPSLDMVLFSVVEP